MDQEAQDAKLITHLSEAFNKDEVWQLAAAEAWGKATPLQLVLIRESTTSAKQLKLVDALIHKTSADGLGGSAAGAGPPASKLRLRQDSQNQDLFIFEPMYAISAAAAASPGVDRRFFLDPGGRQIAELQDWLGLAEELRRVGRPILPLFINGPVKSGKSYILNEVLPAVANTYCSGGSGWQHFGAVPSEPNFLRVNCYSCQRSSSGGFLAGWLQKLKERAAEQQLSAAASTPVPSDRSADAMAVAIRDFMRRLPRDRLNFLLIDEAQSFYLIERPMLDDCPPRGSTLDVGAVLHMRRILKELMLDSPHWVAWAVVTGSSMATLWANVAATPTNGFSLIMHHRRLNLNPMITMDALQVAWEQLKAQAATCNRALPSDLVWRSPPQIAMLAYLCQEWECSLKASTAAELVEQTMTEKLIPEVLEDLRMVLRVLGQPMAQMLLLRELLDPLAGVESKRLPLAFKALLASFATERDGRLYLEYPLLAHVLQAVTTESGELLDSIDTVQSISSKMFRELVVLGECCKDSANFDSYEELHSLLKDMATALALTPDKLLAADWFIHILDHPRNSRGSKANFDLKYRAKAEKDVTVGLRWFHGLLRNVLSHGSISEHRQALQVYPSKLAEFHSSGRISEVLTKTYNKPAPLRSKAPGASAAATPRARPQLHAGPVRPMSLHLGVRLGRAAAAQPRYMGRM